jgi:hypothetical protein
MNAAMMLDSAYQAPALTEKVIAVGLSPDAGKDSSPGDFVDQDCSRVLRR